MLLVLLVLLRCSAAHSHGFHPRFALSQYFSVNQTRHTGVLELTAQNAGSVFSKRAFRNELILASFTADDVRHAYSYAQQHTQHTGYHHFLLLGSGLQACASLENYWNNELTFPGCVYQQPVGLPTSTSMDSKDNIYTLWLKRYAVVALVLKHGYNVLLTDLDVAFYGDVYADFKSHTFKDVNFFLMNAEINGGLFYVQNAKPDGPIQWTFQEVVFRGAIIDAYTDQTGDLLSAGCTQMDQAILAELINLLTHPDMAPEVWPCLSPAVYKETLWQNATQPLKNYSVVPNPQFGALHPNTHQKVLSPAYESRALRYWTDFGLNTERLKTFGPTAFNYATAYRLNRAGTEEVAIRAPRVVFDTWESTVSGWNTHVPVPYASVVHFVAYGQHWGNNGNTKASKWHAMQYSGLFWDNDEPKHLLGVSADVVALHSDSWQQFNDLINRVIATAKTKGKVPIVPAVLCSLSWIDKSTTSRYGVIDTVQSNFLSSQDWCYPAVNTECVDCVPMFTIDGYGSKNTKDDIEWVSSL